MPGSVTAASGGNHSLIAREPNEAVPQPAPLPFDLFAPFWITPGRLIARTNFFQIAPVALPPPVATKLANESPSPQADPAIAGISLTARDTPPPLLSAVTPPTKTFGFGSMVLGQYTGSVNGIAAGVILNGVASKPDLQHVYFTLGFFGNVPGLGSGYAGWKLLNKR